MGNFFCKDKKIMNKIFNLIVPISCFLVIVIAFSMSANAYIEKDPNKKICFGIRRADNHKNPDLGTENLELFKKYKVIALENTNEKNLYLTFDLGYDAGYTEKILDILKKHNVKATFFITAHYLNTNEALVKRMIEEGHIVGNHTVNHKSLPEISEKELEKEIMNLHTMIYEKTGYEMKYARPPKGEYSESVLKKCNALGYKVVMWSFAYDDWDEKKQGREEYGKEKIMDNLHPGEVMLLHGTSKDNMNILDSVLSAIKSEGYKIKSLDQYNIN